MTKLFAPLGIKTRLRLGGLLALGCVLVPLLVLILAAWRDYDDVGLQVKQEVSSEREHFHQRVYTIFKTTEAIAHGLMKIIEGKDWSEIEHSQDIHNYLEGTAKQFPEIHGIYLDDATGTARAASDTFPTPHHSIADREFYKLMVTTKAPTVVSRPFQTRLGKSVAAFNVSYRLTNPDGTFRGLIGFAISIEDVLRLFPAYGRDEPGAASSVFREDGAILVRYPPAAKNAPDSFAANSAFIDALRTSDVYSGDGVSSIDGQWRTYSVQRIGDFPIFVGHTKSQETVNARWWQHFKTYIAFFVSAVLLLLAMAFVTLRSYSARYHEMARNALGLEKLVAERTRHLNRALEEKTALFREVNHRVKNNLQIIASLVRLQNSRGGSPGDLERRIEAMALVHQLLYSKSEAAALNLADYVPKLCDALQSGFGQGTEFKPKSRR